VESNFRRTTSSRHPRLWLSVAANDSGIEIPKAIDLRRAKKPDIDATSLQPVGKNFR
jgi:hypothetical protein